MQVRFSAGLTSEDYVKQEAWRFARLERCPFHPDGGCGYASHGTYARVDPPGCRIARGYCPTARATVSLLPDCLSARLTGTLDEVEAVVAMADGAAGQEAVSEALRPDVELPGALRWVRRRRRLVRAALSAVIGLLPGVLAGREPTVSSIRSALEAEMALVRLRAVVAPYLAALPPPLGFGPRPARRRPSPTASQQEAGPDPPPPAR